MSTSCTTMSSSSEFDHQNFKPTFKLRLQIVVLVLLVVGNKLVSDSLTFNCKHLAPVQVGDLALLHSRILRVLGHDVHRCETI